jgi:hypothetical protein
MNKHLGIRSSPERRAQMLDRLLASFEHVRSFIPSIVSGSRPPLFACPSNLDDCELPVVLRYAERVAVERNYNVAELREMHDTFELSRPLNHWVQVSGGPHAGVLAHGPSRKAIAAWLTHGIVNNNYWSERTWTQELRSACVPNSVGRHALAMIYAMRSVENPAENYLFNELFEGWAPVRLGSPFDLRKPSDQWLVRVDKLLEVGHPLGQPLAELGAAVRGGRADASEPVIDFYDRVDEAVANLLDVLVVAIIAHGRRRASISASIF